MITGFPYQTEPLNEIELELLPAFINGLKTKIGAENAITNSEIRKAFKEKLGILIPDSRVRKIINHIRINGLVPLLCANSNGYYVAKNAKEITSYIKGLNERIGSQIAMLDAIKKQQEQFISTNQ